jgi:outer membrane receptor protein involved in Fe transport
VKGVEATIASHWKRGQLSQNARASYQLTRSITEKAGRAEASSIGKQLIYTPVHTASAMVATSFKKWTTNIFLQYSGKRFTESSNTAIYSLEPFVLADLSFGRSFEREQHVFNIHAAVKNILNTNYQLYSGLAMPGRYYNLQITYQLKHKPE